MSVRISIENSSDLVIRFGNRFVFPIVVGNTNDHHRIFIIQHVILCKEDRSLTLNDEQRFTTVIQAPTYMSKVAYLTFEHNADWISIVRRAKDDTAVSLLLAAVGIFKS